MKRTILALTATTALTLTACSGGEDAPSRSDEIAELQFETIDALDQRTADQYGGTAELHEGDLTVTINSDGMELTDQGNTLKVLEEIGNAADFDYDTVTVTASTDQGNWGYRYNPETVQDAADGNIVVTDIWDTAEAGTNHAY